MKHCSDCKQDLPLETFGKNKAAKDGLTWSCKPCINARMREGHKRRCKDPDYKEKHLLRVRERAQSRKAWIVDNVFGGNCYDCGEVYPPCVFDFHHEGDGADKEANPSQLIGRGQMKEALSELEKCVMLCANCHRMRHFHNKDLE